jgi:FkbM family methyltransferase
MRLRDIRRRLTPMWMGTARRRRWRDVLYRRLGIQRCYTPPLVTRRPEIVVRSMLPFVVAHEIVRNPHLTFLQIGAFDGEGDDDLRELIVRHRLRGVLVEPQPAAFARLQQTYSDQPQVTLLQAAIAERRGMRDLYCRRGRSSMAASFDRTHLLRHGIAEDEIIAQPVVCHTVQSTLHAASLDRVDLIQIDAEGYDWPIIRSIDFRTMRPSILRFEYRNMHGRDADACLAFLASHGYRFVVEPRDIIAHHPAGTANPIATASSGKLCA